MKLRGVLRTLLLSLLHLCRVLSSDMTVDSVRQPMPWILKMSVDPSHDLHDRSCEPCDDMNQLGTMCCGMCAFGEVGRTQSALEDRQREGSCKMHLVVQMLKDLKGRGINLEAFQPHDLYDSIKGRTLWLIGDSQMQDWYRTLECFLSPHLAQAPRVQATNISTANLWLVHFERWRQMTDIPRSSPTPAICAVIREGTRVCYVRTHMVEDIMYPVLRILKRDVKDAHRDIAVINAGLHYGVDSPFYNSGLIDLKNYILEHKKKLPLILWKDTSPQHMPQHSKADSRSLDDSKGKSMEMPPVECRPFTEKELGSSEMLAGGWHNEIAFRHMQDAGVPILDAYRITLPMWQMHVREDCTHFCSPGAYEVWTYLLSKTLKDLKAAMLPRLGDS